MTTMARLHHVLPVALLCLLAAACQPAPDAQPATGTTDAAAGKERSFIGRQAARAIGKAGEKLRTQNLPLGGNGPTIVINGRSYGTGHEAKGLPKAELTPDGELLVAGEKIATTPAQQALLREHRRLLEDLALAGMAIGAQGADIAGTALTGVGQAIFGGEEGRQAYEARIEAEAARIEADAQQLCVLLPPLYASQQALAASLPAFAPYATMTAADADGCGRDAGEATADAAGGTSA